MYCELCIANYVLRIMYCELCIANYEFYQGRKGINRVVPLSRFIPRLVLVELTCMSATDAQEALQAREAWIITSARDKLSVKDLHITARPATKDFQAVDHFGSIRRAVYLKKLYMVREWMVMMHQSWR